MKLKMKGCFIPVILIIFLLSGCSAQSQNKQTEEYSSQQFMMDTFISIKAYGQNKEQLEKAVGAAFGEMKRIDLLTNRFPKQGNKEYEKSDICKVNSYGDKRPVKLDKDVFKLIDMSLYYSKISEGAFDITVAPVMDLWNFQSDNPRVPSDSEIKEKLKLVSYKFVKLNKEEGTVFLTKPGVKIDLGAIAKGYAAQKAADVLRKYGIKQALINAGGNIIVIGKKDNATPWKIGIEDPRDASSVAGILSLSDETAVTSGDYQRNFVKNGVLYHHILDPKTGKPANKTWSVTIITKDSGIADALSTTLFVLGPEKGLELTKKLKGIDAFYVGSNKHISISNGLKNKVTVEEGSKYIYDKK